MLLLFRSAYGFVSIEKLLWLINQILHLHIPEYVQLHVCVMFLFYVLLITFFDWYLVFKRAIMIWSLQVWIELTAHIPSRILRKQANCIKNFVIFRCIAKMEISVRMKWPGILGVYQNLKSLSCNRYHASSLFSSKCIALKKVSQFEMAQQRSHLIISIVYNGLSSENTFFTFIKLFYRILDFFATLSSFTHQIYGLDKQYNTN